MSKTISLREISRLCKVSPATVSRIAKGAGNFSDETRALVLRTMLEAGYDVDPGSIPVVSNPVSAFSKNNLEERRAVGVVLYDYRNEFFTSILAEIDRCLSDQFTVISCCSERDVEKEAKCISWLRAQKVAGLVVFSFIDNHFIPSIPDIPVVYWGVPALAKEYPEHYFVSSDDYVGGQLAARELLRKGCRQPIILNNRLLGRSPSGDEFHLSVRRNDRISGFLDEFEKNNIMLSENEVFQTDLRKSSFENGRDTVSYLLAKGMDFDSVFACNDWLAYGALTALHTDNVPVPEQIKVIGFDGLRIALNGNPPITTICQNVAGIGQTICSTLTTLMEGNDPQTRHISVPIALFEGRTT